jgi:hypothetical protein
MQAFNDLVSMFGLIDYKGNNHKYSWARGGASTQLALLDRFFVNFIWESQYASTSSYYLYRFLFYHAPLIFSSVRMPHR